MKEKIYFITSNIFKEEECRRSFEGSNYEINIIPTQIQEVMDLNLEEIVRDKLLKAYKSFGNPCVVEHGAIHIDALNGLPGGISKVVWDSIQGKICTLIQPKESRKAIAKALIGYCDGKKLYYFSGETKGTIAKKPLGKRKFQWDPIFIPEGSKRTYGQLGFPGKEKFSQASKAWKLFIEYLETTKT
jgi:XTP/dITP diphosphohydrolase